MFGDPHAHVDLYCERTGPEFWSEPINALTNLAFVAAGLWGVWMARKQRADGFVLLLCWWVVAIGIGSFLFHTFANQLTIWADILPIAGFTLAYTLFNLRRFLGYSWPRSLVIFFSFYIAVGALTLMVPDWLRVASNGSTGYLPPFLALIFFGILVIRAGNPIGWFNIAAAGIFVLSVTFRAIDPLVCGAMPLGTHFLWHSFNGLMLGVVLAAVLRFAHRRT
ncbi:ceramidase domain-containing protein [Mesorhizobium sp. CAU 1741]|uniref:ceramidase domain-containing protein n=1 Tax=Mesorhizobium sp. CAU 1741 TaxID=3140366 RepID=UPI00325B0D62